ncbi:hypothetical protein [Caproicibacter sp.]|uniref:hypothetical protein n=1 Tax=Caproicibacter sp. TaxID=2814884 RepID=UPI003988BE65
MSSFLKTVGLLTLPAAIVLLFLMADNLNFFSVLCVFLLITLGLALVELGDLMERVSSLESRLDPPPEKPEEDEIQKVVCPNCYKKYDLDSPKCPYCGTKNELW